MTPKNPAVNFVWTKALEQLCQADFLTPIPEHVARETGTSRVFLKPKDPRHSLMDCHAAILNGALPSSVVRILCDYSQLNKFLEIPAGAGLTVDQAQAQVAGTRYLSVIDLKDGYFQLPLDPHSATYLSLSTPLGYFRPKRLMQGLSPAVSLFTNTIHRYILEHVSIEDLTIDGIRAIIAYLDDLLVRDNPHD